MLKVSVTGFASSIMFVSAAFCQPTVPSLVLQRGEDREITASRWEFSKVDIPEGATLRVVPGSSQPLELIVTGDFRLRGRIVAREWSSDDTKFDVHPKNGSPETVFVKNNNRGGRGGDGADGPTRGGRGAKGTVDYGGGGGGGGVNATSHGDPGRVNGLDATDDRGAPSAVANCGQRGVNGGQRQVRGNGGVLFLEVDGEFDAVGGIVDLGGNDGSRGQDGLPVLRVSTNCAAGAGGAGGGGPGGQGGILIAKLHGAVRGYPEIRIKGGSGGVAGKTAQTAGAAENGQPGTSGWVRWDIGP